MKTLNGLFFLTLPTITVLAKPFTGENGGTGPDDVKCTLSTVSVKNPNELLTFDDGHCVYSKSIDQCKTGMALLQFYSPQNVCPQEIIDGQNPSQVPVPCCVHIECGPKGEGTCLNTPDTAINDCKGVLVEDEDRCPEGKSKTMCCVRSAHESADIDYPKDQMVAVDSGIQSSYEEGLRDDRHPFGDELWSPGVGDSGLFQDGGDGGADCLVWGMNCPIS